MAGGLSYSKLLSKLTQGQLDPLEQTPVKSESKYKIFIHQNASEYVVCEIAAVLSKGRWVNDNVPSMWATKHWLVNQRSIALDLNDKNMVQLQPRSGLIGRSRAGTA